MQQPLQQGLRLLIPNNTLTLVVVISGPHANLCLIAYISTLKTNISALLPGDAYLHIQQIYICNSYSILDTPLNTSVNLEGK